MDEQKSGAAVNGAKGSAGSRQNDPEAKVNKTLLLKMQIEENRIRMQQREKEISNSKRNLEQLFTQLDRSCSGVSLNLSTDVEDVRDTKIASLESSLSALKSEKRELDLRLLSLETIQEAKENLELEMNELRASHDHLSIENNMLQARVQNVHALEDENDELKLTLDRLAYENSSLKEDLETRDGTINSLEAKLSRLNHDLEEINSQITSMVPYTLVEDLQQQINQLANERDILKSDCEALQTKLNEGMAAAVVASAPEVSDVPEVKVSSLGAKKKPRGRRSKGDNQPAADESKSEDTSLAVLESQITLLTAQRDTLEGENVTLKTSILNLENKLDEADTERRTLQQRVELLMAELSAETSGYNNNDVANLQMLLQEKEVEYATLSTKVQSLQAEAESLESEKREMAERLEKADGELFQLRTKYRDAEYTVNAKEETIRELQARLASQPVETPIVQEADVPAPVKVSSLGAAKKSRRSKGGRAANEPKIPSTEVTPNASESEIATLNAKISSLEEEIASLNEQTARLAILENEITILQEQLAVSEQEKRTLQKRVDLLLSELDTNESKGELENFQEVLQLKEDECGQLSAKIADIQAEKNEINQRLEEADSELFKLRAQHRDTQYILNNKDESISELERQVESRRGEVDHLKEVIAGLERKLELKESVEEEEEKSISNTVIHLQEALRQTREELSSFETELTNRSEAVQKLEKSCSSLTKEATERNAEIQRLKEDLQDAEILLAEKDAKLKTVQDELNRMKITADEHSSLAMLETELNDSQVEKELMRNDLETRCTQLNECKQYSVKIEAQLEEARAREAELLGQIEAANTQKTTAEEKVTQLSEKFKKLAANYKQKLQVIQQLEAKLEKLKKAAEGDGGEPQLLQVRLVETESEMVVLKEQLSKLKDTAEQLTQARQTLSQTEEQLQNAQEEAQQVGEENKKLLDQLDEYKDLNNQLEEARLALSQREERLHSFQEEVNQLTEENNNLQVQISSMSNELHISKSEAMEENQKLLDQMNELKAATGQSSQYQEALQRSENELEALRGHLQQSRAENEKLVDRLGEITQVNNHLEEMKLALDRAHNDLSACQIELQNAREESQQMSDESRKMMEQLERASERIFQLEQLSNESEFRARETDTRLQHLTEEHSNIIGQLQRELASAREQLQSISSSYGDQGLIQKSLENRIELAENEASDLRLKLNEVSSAKDNLLEESEGLRRRIEELQGEVNSAVESSATLHNQLAHLWEEKQSVINHNAHLVDELNKLKCHQDEQSSTQSASLEKEIQELRDQLAAAQWDLDTKTNELSSAQQVREQLSAVQWELDAKVSELSAIQQQREADIERIAQLEKQCSDTSAWIETNVEDVSALKSRIQDLENQLADLNNQYGGLYSTYGSKLFEMTALENQLADANLKVADLSEQLARHQSSMDELTAKNSAMEQDAGATHVLREQLTELEKTNANLLDELSHLKERASEMDNIQSLMEGLTQERDELRRANDSLQLTIEQQTEGLNQKEVEMAEVRKQMEDFQSIFEGFSGERNRLNDELRLKESELEESKQRLVGLEDRINELQKNTSDVQEIGMLRMNLADLSAERDDLSYQVEDVQAQCSDLETKLGEAEEVRSILETTVSYLETKVSELQAEVAAANAAREEDQSSNASQLTALTEERDALAARLSSVQSENQELTSLRLTLDEAERMLKESDSSLTSARQSHADALARVEEMEKQLVDSLRCLSEEQQKHRVVRDELEELVEQTAQATQVRSDLQEQVTQLQSELIRVEAVAAMCNQYKAEAEEFARLRNQIDEWKHQAEEVSQLRLKLFEAISEKDDLEASVQALEEELATVQNDLASVRMQLEAKNDSSTELSTVQYELAMVQGELANARSELDRVNRMSSENSLAAQVQLDAARNELEASRQSLAELTIVKKELEANLSSASAELESLRGELESGRVSTFELNARCADLDMERNLLMEKCMELKDSQHALESKCADLEQLRTDAIAENERLQSELSKSAGSSSQLTESSLSELAQLRVAMMDLTYEREEFEEKLAEAEEKLVELTSLRITNSELSMELEEAQARIQVIEEERYAEVSEVKRQLAETVMKISQQEERIDRVSIERDQLQQTVSRLGESTVRCEKAEMETQEKTEGNDESDLLKKIAGLESELHEAKIKAAKSLRQVKLLRTELAKEKDAAAAAASARQGGGDDYFNFAVEEELRKQLSEAEKATNEKVKEIERLLMRIDTLEGANERFMQAKERQDNEMAMVQQRNRELMSQMASMEWDNPEASAKERAPEEVNLVTKETVETTSEQIAALESTISQLTDDNENYQDMLDELKAERQAVEAELKEQIAALEADISEKSKLLDEISQEVENKDRLLSDAYESVSQLRKQVMQLSETGGGDSAGVLEELRRENENLVDMIRQLSTTGTLDAATVQRLKDEIEQVAIEDGDRFQQSSDLSDGAIDWHRGFNELQIEVEYLRSQNVSLLNRLQEAGLVWDEGADTSGEDSDRLEMLRLQLDNAIRNVHDRDMRCQELTWEITKLLEERDTLQLRLSNSLRQNHEMQQELKDFSATASGASPIGDITAKLRELKQLNYSLDVQLRREQEERQTIERQLMALYGTRGGSTSPIYANGARRATVRQTTQNDDDGSEFDLNNSHEISGTGQVLSEWLKGKESTDVQHV
ncbi:golgin subfamily B member 1-like [Daphnia carinata]|uniref:golgin subfamily B member 1-like n=1 Tax=Daphnia carinata TaxID=120202 RepID=UPI00257B43A5|nr:golgin subfamily B member 1-like [Daphnia carinata]